MTTAGIVIKRFNEIYPDNTITERERLLINLLVEELTDVIDDKSRKAKDSAMHNVLMAQALANMGR